MLTSGRGRYRVWVKKQTIGEDILLILGGGEKPHVGSVVVCEPGRETRVIKLEGHYDEVVLKPLAEKTCRRYKKTVVAVGGIHIDNASKEEIDILIKNSKNLMRLI